MKILIVTWFFPPTNTIGAIRLGDVARDLLAAGHDVQVLSAVDPPFPPLLNLIAYNLIRIPKLAVV